MNILVIGAKLFGWLPQDLLFVFIPPILRMRASSSIFKNHREMRATISE
jgi:hypothetical protein